MTTVTPERLTQAWRTLQDLIPVMVIRTEQQYDKAVETLNMLIDLVGTDTEHQLYDLLDTLGTLVHAYEDEHETTTVPTNAAMLELLMAEHEVAPSQLPELGEPAFVNDILAGRRTLTSPQLQALARRFGVTPETFVSA